MTSWVGRSWLVFEWIIVIWLAILTSKIGPIMIRLREMEEQIGPHAKQAIKMSTHLVEMQKDVKILVDSIMSQPRKDG